MLVRELLFELGFDSAKAEKNAKKMDKVVNGLKRNLFRLGAVTLTAAVGLGAAALKAGNDYQSMSNKLKLVTDGTNELKSAQEGVFAISQKARTSLEASTDLYFGMAKAGEQYGFSQERILRITETTAKLATLASNKDPAGTNAALFQLRQGIMSGQLRGQELNSVLEQATPVADAIAKGMGIPFAEIRKMAEQGEVTGIAVLRALESQAGDTDKQFALLDRTAEQARQQLKNAFGFYAGRLAEDSDSVKAQVEFYDALRDIISSGSFKNSLVFALNTMTAIIKILKRLVDGLQSVMEAVGGLSGALKHLSAAFLAVTTIIVARAVPSLILWAWYVGGLIALNIAAAGGFWALAAGVLAATWPILAIIAAIGVLYLVYEDLISFFQGGDSIIGRMIERWSDWKRVLADVFTAPLLGIQFLYNGVAKLLNLMGADIQMVNFSDSLYNQLKALETDVDLQTVGKKSMQGAAVNQTNVNETKIDITVPPGTNKEQLDYMDARIRQSIDAHNQKQLREARNNFPETE